MDRKRFKATAAVVVLVLLGAYGAAAVESDDSAETKPPAQNAWPIGFGSGEITDVHWVDGPERIGKRSEQAEESDTFRIENMCRRALRQNLKTLVPDRDNFGYQPNQWGSAETVPPLNVGSKHHEYSEVAEQAGRCGIALAYLRTATNSTEAMDKEDGMIRLMARVADQYHGIFAQPVPSPEASRPWSLEDNLKHFTEVGFAVPLALEAWILRYERMREPQLRQNIKKVVALLRRIAVHDPSGYAYFPSRVVPFDQQGNVAWPSPSDLTGAYHYGAAASVGPLAHWAQLTGDDDLMEFVRSLADGTIAGAGMPPPEAPLKFARIRRDGSWELDVSRSKWAYPGGNIPDQLPNPIIFPGQESWTHEGEVHWGNAHVLSVITYAWGMSHAGMIMNEPRYIDWAKRMYDHLLSVGSDVGWFPEHLPWPWVGNDQRLRSETCNTGEMVDIARYLAQAGHTDYWDHVERYARNYLAEMQFKMTPDFEAFYREHNKDKDSQVVEAGLAALREKLEGGFIATAVPNEYVMEGGHIGCMGCCTWNGARAAGGAAIGVVTTNDTAVYINMALNRETRQCKVVSYLPSQGRVTVVVKTSSQFHLRPPAWAPRHRVKAFRNGQLIPVRRAGAYVTFDNAKPSEELTITYPIPHFLQHLAIPGRHGVVARYTLEWLGNSVVNIAPQGKYLPLYRDRTKFLAAAGRKSMLPSK